MAFSMTYGIPPPPVPVKAPVAVATPKAGRVSRSRKGGSLQAQGLFAPAPARSEQAPALLPAMEVPGDGATLLARAETPVPAETGTEAERARGDTPSRT